MKRPERSTAYIGRYSILGLSGRDTRGLRYHVYDMEHQRDATLLVLDVTSLTETGRDGLERSSATVLAALQRWFAALRLLSHPSVAQVYEVNAIDGLVFVAYEYVPGT